jgi:hypothetical protein
MPSEARAFKNVLDYFVHLIWSLRHSLHSSIYQLVQSACQHVPETTGWLIGRTRKIGVPWSTDTGFALNLCGGRRCWTW